MKTVFKHPAFLFSLLILAYAAVGWFQSINVMLTILGMGLISAIMAQGINIQWGYAGLLNVGVMGFAALGGAVAVWVSAPMLPAALIAGGPGLMAGLLAIALAVAIAIYLRRRTSLKGLAMFFCDALVFMLALTALRYFAGPAITSIEKIDPALNGYIGGLGLPILLSWPLGGLAAAGAAWLIGRISLGLRADYLAIATLGISEILVSILKNEDWLARGVKNVVGLPRPVPYEVNLIEKNWVQEMAASFSMGVPDFATMIVRGSYCLLFLAVLLALMWFCQRALHSPWGRMMRSIRDNETAADAMGKDVKSKHLLVFILGSAVIGTAGAMMVTLDSQFTPGSYQPLRYTFLIWVMVIVGGSGNNWGAVFGGLFIWLLWVQAEPTGVWLLTGLTGLMSDDHPLRLHLIENASQLRLVLMGVILLITLRFAPKGLIPER